jgi:hypothetical protein
VAKRLGVVCVALGAFLLVLAGMAKWYAYDRLAVVPLDQNTTAATADDPDADKQSESYGPDATYLKVTKAGASIENDDLVSIRRVVGQVEASQEASDELDQDIAIWETYSFSNPAEDKYNDDSPLSGRIDLVAFDRTTGEAVDCCDTLTQAGMDLETGEPLPPRPLTFEGHYFKLPFNTQKQEYLFWDGSLEKATPLVFEDEEEIEGVTVYRFKQTIEPTDIDLQASRGESEFTSVPGSLVGRPDKPSVKTNRMYSNVRTLWIEPETGVIIKAEEEQLTTLDVAGEPVATITEVTIGYDEATIAANADTYGSLSSQLKLIRVTVPVVGLTVGLLLVLIGALLLLRDGSAARGRRAATG